jgi:hypothetical protein
MLNAESGGVDRTATNPQKNAVNQIKKQNEIYLHVSTNGVLCYNATTTTTFRVYLTETLFLLSLKRFTYEQQTQTTVPFQLELKAKTCISL